MSWLAATSNPPLTPLDTAAPPSIKAVVVLSSTWTIAEPPMPNVDDLLPKNEKKLPARAKVDAASRSVKASRSPRSFRNRYMMPVTLTSSRPVAAATRTCWSSFCPFWFSLAPLRTIACEVLAYWV